MAAVQTAFGGCYGWRTGQDRVPWQGRQTISSTWGLINSPGLVRGGSNLDPYLLPKTGLPNEPAAPQALKDCRSFHPCHFTC